MVEQTNARDKVQKDLLNLATKLKSEFGSMKPIEIEQGCGKAASFTHNGAQGMICEYEVESGVSVDQLKSVCSNFWEKQI